MIGAPKFKREDRVTFVWEVEGEKKKINGVIYVVDADGTAEQTEEPSYDIEAFYEGQVVLFKHIRESLVELRAEQI